MVINSLKLETLEHGQELMLVRYSHAEHPDFVNAKFKSYNPGTRTILFTVIDKDIDKKINTAKAQFRLFIDKHEMARSLFDCFIKRNIPLIEDYKTMMLESQDARPEIWI